MSNRLTDRARPISRRCPLVLLVLGAGMAALSGCMGPTVETTWSPDGKQIAYIAGTERGELRVYDTATRESQRLYAGPEDFSSPAWSPDGSAIAFYALTLEAEDRMAASVRVAAISTGAVQTLADDVWRLPDAVAATVEAEPGQSRVEALREAELGWFLFVASDGSVAWSPDGKRLAWSASRDRGGAVFIADYPGGEARPVVEALGIVGPVAWSPDGMRLAYVFQPGELTGISANEACQPGAEGEPESLWLWDAATGAEVKATDIPTHASRTRLEWSDDSRRIGFIAQDVGPGMGIGCVAEARPGATPRKDVLGITAAAAWSPGLGGIAFVEEREGDEVVLLYRGARPVVRKALGVLGVPPFRLFDSGDEDEEGSNPYSLPQFSPDGRYVALRVGKTADDARIAVFPVNREDVP